MLGCVLRMIFPLAFIFSVCAFALPPAGSESTASTRQSLDDRFFGTHAAPGLLVVHNEEKLARLLDPAVLKRLKNLRIGLIVLHEGLYAAGPRPPYVYRDPQLVARVCRLLSLVGIARAVYVHPAFCRQAGMSTVGIIALIDELLNRIGADSVFLDGGDIGGNVWETWDGFKRLRLRLGPSGKIIVHGSYQANLGYVSYRPPWLDDDRVGIDYYLWGERGGTANPVPADLNDPIWSTQVSHAMYGVIGMYRAPKGSKWSISADRDEYDPSFGRILPSLRCVPWGGFGRALDEVYERHFFPAYQKLREEYAASPGGG